MATLPRHARAVIIGGGIVGCSVAYHLTKLGWRDVVLLERKKLASGTSWHAAGLVGQLRATQNLTQLAVYGARLYGTLEAETGQATGFQRRGSMAVARTKGRMDQYLHQLGLGKCFGVEVHPLSPREAGEKWPLMRSDDLVGAIWIPGDGQTNPVDTVAALGKGARMGGAKIFEGVKVDRVLMRQGRAVGVSAAGGEIAAEVVINCGGMWARDLALASGAHVPLHAAEHMYIVTQPMAGMHAGLPSLRDYDGHIYIKEDAGKLLLGGFEPKAKPWGMDGIPESFEFDVLPEDWDQFEILMSNGLHRVPTLEKAEVRQLLVGPESFTPDNRYYLGEAPGLRNYFVAAGFNSIGIASSAGAGKAVAEWIVSGEPSMDLSDVDIRRATPFMTNKRYLFDRTIEALGNMYAPHWPFKQYETARGARRSAVHAALAESRACFGAVAGWERANWFAPKGVAPKYEYSFERQNWFAYSAAEHMAVRQAAGLFDQSSFAKILVQGPDAERLLQRVCANDVGGAPGRVIYTQWLNAKGGIEADLTVTRWAEDGYVVVTAAASAIRDLEWLRRAVAPGERVAIADITPAWGTLSLMGPRARDILSGVAESDVSNAAFPYLAAREIEVAGVRVRAQRVTYVGELGWELYVPTPEMHRVFGALRSAGERHGLALAGYHALDSLRLEKGYRHWGHDIGSEDTPIESGLGFAVAWNKDFIGRAAIEAQRNVRLTKRLVQFVLDDPEPLLIHDEPIWRGERIVGRITSGGYGHALGRATGLGYVRDDNGVDAAHIAAQGFEIEIHGKRYGAKASFRAPYDPKGERLRT